MRFSPHVQRTFGDYVCNKIIGINATPQEALSK